MNTPQPRPARSARPVVDVDVVVVGLGIHGSATAWELARRGVGVLGLDRFPRGHTRGSSHGRTRMIRRAYPDPVWNPFVEQAQQGWARWEAESGVRLIHRTGGLYACVGESRLQGPGCVRVDDPALLRRTVPGLSLPAGYSAVHDPSAGVVEAAAALDVARSAATSLGAELAFGEQVLRVEPLGEGCLVETDRRSVRTRRAVLTAGAWNGVLEPSLAGLFSVWRILTVTLRPGQAVAQPPVLTAFSVDRPEGLVFGLPDVDGSGFKIGVDAERPWDPELPPAPPTSAEVEELLDLATGLVPGLEPDGAEAAACLYTMTEDKRFVLGSLPHAPQVVVAAACSGHGFKFGPAVGVAAADLALGTPRPDLEFIGVERRVAA